MPTSQSMFCDYCCGFADAKPFCISTFGCPATGKCEPSSVISVNCLQDSNLCADYQSCASDGVCKGKDCSIDDKICEPNGVCNEGKCISSGCGGKVGETIDDFVYGSWTMQESKLGLVINANVYCAPAPVAMYTIMNLSPLDNNLVIIFIRIYSDTNIIGSIDTKWLGPFVGKIINSKLCVITDPMYNSPNDGYTIIPDCPIVAEGEDGFNDKGELYVHILSKGYMNSRVRYSDIYEGKMWSCTIDSINKKLSFTLTFNINGTQYNFGKEAVRLNSSKEMNKSAPVNVYKNAGCSDTICPSTMDVLWKGILIAIGVVSLIIILILSIYVGKYKHKFKQ